jgi:PAS domain S-box-containing protein
MTIEVNARMTEMLGYSAEEITGKPLTAFMVPEDRPDHLEKMANRRRGFSEHYERRFVHKDGQIVWTSVSATPILDREDHFVGCFAMVTDFTERRRAEQELFLMSFALNNARESAFLIDREGRFRLVNEEACRILGYSRAELLDKGVVDVDLEYPRERWAAHWEELRSRRALLFEGRYRSRVGRIFPVEISANYFEYEGEGYNMALVRDTTERKLAEEQLRERESFIRTILDSVDEAIIVVGRQYRILSANRAFCDAVNLPEERVVGNRCYEIGCGAERPCWESGEECVVRRTFETAAHHAMSRIHVDPAGTKRCLELRSFPIMDDAGAVVSVVETCNDVTVKRRLEAQLRHAQKMEAIGTLAGGVAHDFNNLLTGIIGYGNLIQLELKPDDPLQSSIQEILAASDRATQLAGDLLAFSRKQVLNPKPVDLNENVRNVEKLLRRLIGEDIELSTRYAPGSLAILADPRQIERVLVNLATNARDAMPEGGQLMITTQVTQVDEGYSGGNGFRSPGKYALITVSDTGRGMDEPTRQKAFEPFFTTKEGEKGTGLGLSIVYGILEQHNATIDVDSELGRGTTFKILLPLVSTAAAKVDSRGLAPPARGTETLLLAEDDTRVRTLITTTLKESGYRVIEAVDGADALEKFAAQWETIEMAILDVIMPRKSGREVYDAMRAQRPDVPVLFISGYTADIIDKRGFFDGELQFISKPFSRFDLLRKIRKILDER